MNLYGKLRSYVENIPSLFLLVLPYILITYPQIKESDAFSCVYFYLILVLLFIVDLLYIKLFKRVASLNSKLVYPFHFIYVAFFIFFYSNFFLLPLIRLSYELNLFLRGRGIILFLFPFLLIIVVMNKKIYIFCNRTIIIICIFTLINYSYKAYTSKGISKTESLKTPSNKILKISHRSDKPVILLILDEYASPLVFEKVNIKKETPDLSDYLDSAHWIIKKNSFSNETSTIYSISSLLNYNLSENSNYSTASLIKVSQNLNHAAVITDLQMKNILFKNYSIFKVANYHPYEYLYASPDSFIDLFLMNSIYLIAKKTTGNFKITTLKWEYYISSDYNQNIYKLTKSILNHKESSNQFIYLHFFMPHSPIHYGNEINLDGYSINNYYRYWLFVNKKMIALLKQAKYLKDYRIIISGDHGYRSDKRINPHQTFTAFYGFDKSDVDQLHSVQDIGSLIEGSF